MTGVSLEQWRGSIGHFNHFKIRECAPIDRCRNFLIFIAVKHYLEFLKDHINFGCILIYNITILFAFSLITITLLTLTAFALPVFWSLSPDTSFSCRKASLILYIICSFPHHTSALLKKLTYMIDPSVSNTAFFLLVLSLLLILGGIETNPGPNLNKNLSFAVWISFLMKVF